MRAQISDIIASRMKFVGSSVVGPHQPLILAASFKPTLAI